MPSLPMGIHSPRVQNIDGLVIGEDEQALAVLGKDSGEPE
jgi:hypothetical protein